MKNKFLTAVFVLISITASAQYKYRDSNRIGIIFGLNQINLNTDDFTVNPELGWNVGLSVRGNFYNDFDMVYTMQFSENKFTVPTTVPTTNFFPKKVDVDYKLPSAQISLMLSYKIVENHLSVEFGPLVQVNGKFVIDKTDEENVISGNLKAKDIVDISKFNFYPAIGITAGVKHVRANIQYQYGVTNLLGNLNGQEGISTNFKSHPGIISANIIVYL